MIVNLQLGSSCKTPEHGDIYISERDRWSALGYFTLVFSNMENGKEVLRTVPLIFADSLNRKEFIGKCSLGYPEEFILSIAKVEVK